MGQLNAYGDILVGTTGRHGGDISSQRMDDLDKEALSFAVHHAKPSSVALDLGCGIGLQGLRFASVGCRTILVDILPAEQTVLQCERIQQLISIRYVQKDARLLTTRDFPEPVDICYSQRFIHYFPFDDAVALLQLIKEILAADGKVFLSASGLASELGQGYEARSQTVSMRFTKLSTEMAIKHNILEPVCLYTEEDLRRLGVLAGFRAERLFSSQFGNVKGIFVGSE